MLFNVAEDIDNQMFVCVCMVCACMHTVLQYTVAISILL